MNKQERNHHANQCNPNNAAYRAAMNNHANQCNPNHQSYQGGSSKANGSKAGNGSQGNSKK